MFKKCLMFLFFVAYAIPLSLAADADVVKEGERRVSGVSSASGRAHKRPSEESSPAKRYAIATTDTAFKHLLSPEPGNFRVLQSFLQTFVPAFNDDPIADIQLMPVAIPVLKEVGKKQTFMDLYVKTAHTHYIIEMQARRHVRFDERALFYACATYSRQLPESRLVAGSPWYTELKPVIAIQILDYDSERIRGAASSASDSLVQRVAGHPMAEDQFVKHFRLTDSISGQIIDHLQMIQVELPRGRSLIEKKEDHRAFTVADWWLELFCFSEDYTPEKLAGLKTDGIVIPEFFEAALERLDRTVWAPAMQREYEVDLTNREAYASVLAVERSEGKAEGLKEGLKEGLERSIRAMKRRRIASNEIAKDLGVPIDEVEAVKIDE